MVVPAAHGAPSARVPERRKRPTTGFVMLCATYLAAGAFLAWGFSTPTLDRVWTLHHELKTGALGAPKGRDLGRMREALDRYPSLAAALLPDAEVGLLGAHRDGWLETTEATVLRTPKARRAVMRIEVGTPLDLLPFEIDVAGRRFDRRLHAREHGVLELRLPEARGKSELYVLRLRGKKLRADPSVLNVRVTFALEDAQ